MALAQGPLGGILYHQKRSAVLHGEIENAHNVRVREICQGLCFLHKAGGVLFAELCVKNFESRTAFEVDMLAQVDLGKASLAKEPSQAIVAQLLAFTQSMVGHTSTSSGLFPWYNVMLSLRLFDVPGVRCQVHWKNPYPRAPAKCP